MRPTRVLAFVVFAIGLTACTRTDDLLRETFTKHSDLIDPSSAIFRNVTHHAGFWEVWCGEVNSKNRMGGYVGWKKFDVAAHTDGKVFVTVAPLDVPFGASDSQKAALDKINKTLDNLHEISCRNTEPAPSWLMPFYKRFTVVGVG